MSFNASQAGQPQSTEYVITKDNSILFDSAAFGGGPVMGWRGAEQHGNFVIESPTPLRNLVGERLVISGSDGSSQPILVTEIADNVVYFRAVDQDGSF